MKLVDPDGRDVWKRDIHGNVIDCIETESFDQIHIMDNDNNIVASSIEFKYGTISEICIEGSSNTSLFVGMEMRNVYSSFFLITILKSLVDVWNGGML